ncbi:MAG: hypothetical protein HZA58_01065 [Acidimicrobiia bacterium]|nr:hypothetical protein [Acidimicrobiia bacterium]
MRRSIVIAVVLAVSIVPAAAMAAEDGARDTTTTAPERVRDHALEELKERAAQMIERQMDLLGRLRSSVAASEHITEGHAATLSGDIGAAAEALESLAAQAEAATTLAEVWEVIRAVPALHIGNVLAPKTHQVIASDALVAFGSKLERFADKLDDLITRAEEKGHDVDAAWRMLEEMTDGIDAGVRLADPVAESVIGLDAGDWPEPAQSTLAAGRRDLRAGGASLRDAYATGRDIVQFLRDLVAEDA